VESIPPSKSDTRTDLELVAAINRGGAEGSAAFEALYFRYRDWVTGLAFRFTRDRDLALDVMQETFLYLLRKFPGFTLTAQLKTFLYPVVRHLALAARQKSRRFATDEAGLEAAQAAGGTPAPPVSGAESGGPGGLAVVLAPLLEGQREVLLLRFVDGLSLPEIAQALGLPLGTVKSRLHYALNSLRDDPRTKKYFEP
jgi:RNA polymerase sigma-70 factor, ECF subfamily